jgi:type III secretion protein R
MDLTTFSPSSALLTIVVLALAPMVAVMVTSFTKLVVVLSLLRNALGLQQVPPNVVLNGLALVLSIFVMYPVGTEMAVRLQGIDNIGKDTKTMMAAADAAKEPLREFLYKHSRPVVRAFLK